MLIPDWLPPLRRSLVAFSNRAFRPDIDVGERGQVALDYADLDWLRRLDLDDELTLGPSPSDNETELLVSLRQLADAPSVTGSGPIAPTFDEFDRAAERRRGNWVVVPARAWDRFVAAYGAAVAAPDAP